MVRIRRRLRVAVGGTRKDYVVRRIGMAIRALRAVVWNLEISMVKGRACP